jgi:hypothetical protein
MSSARFVPFRAEGLWTYFFFVVGVNVLFVFVPGSCCHVLVCYVQTITLTYHIQDL